MKKILQFGLFVIIVAMGCAKVDSVALVTNVYNHEVRFRLDHQKDLRILQPGEELVLDIDGWHHLQFEGIIADSVYIDGFTSWP